MWTCLEDQGGLVSRLIMGLTRVNMWVIGVTNPPSSGLLRKDR